jgi:1-acyl-sn-glycerol-3-phosphate acyltransferase
VGVAGLALLRWRIAGNFPDLGKFVIIVAPHTSNWDFVVGFAAYLALGLDATWFGKHTIFRWPIGVVFRYFGGIPIVRSRSTNVVEAYIAEFARRDAMVLAIAPEGTRSRVAEWKRGFYHIATGAKVPVVPVAFDFASRIIRIFPPFLPTGDVNGDLTLLRGLYDRSMARRPELF